MSVVKRSLGDMEVGEKDDEGDWGVEGVVRREAAGWAS